MQLFPLFFLFRQLCLYISDSLYLFALFLTNSLEKYQTKSFENEYSTFRNKLFSGKLILLCGAACILFIFVVLSSLAALFVLFPA